MTDSHKVSWYRPIDRAIIGALSTLDPDEWTNGYRLGIWVCHAVEVKTDGALYRAIGRLIREGLAVGDIARLALASHHAGAAWRVIEHTGGFQRGAYFARIGTGKPAEASP